jgi:hypothetical protein
VIGNCSRLAVSTPGDASEIDDIFVSLRARDEMQMPAPRMAAS